MNEQKNKDSIPLRPIPKGSWHSKLKSPYQSKRELKNSFKGSLILITFMAGFFGLLYWLFITFGK